MSAGRRTRVLIVDDSAVMRGLLRAVMCSAGDIDVAGTAADGASALNAVASLRPDLVLLDVEMPVMDGLATLRELRARGCTTPVIICSSLTQRGARVTIDALASGADDYVTKPAGQADRQAATRILAQELLPRITALAQGVSSPHDARRPSAVFSGTLPSCTMVPAAPRMVAIGVSTGGPAALDHVLPFFPQSFPLPVVVVQHMPDVFTRVLAERLDGSCALRVREAAEGDLLRSGSIFIARGDWHLEIRPSASAAAPPTLHLTQGPPENHCRPAVDVLFRSAAAVYGGGVLAAVLTGMGADGLAGSRVLRAAGSTVLAQDQATSAVWGMPGAVASAGLANRVLPLDAIGPELVRLAAADPPTVRGTHPLQEPAA